MAGMQQGWKGGLIYEWKWEWWAWWTGVQHRCLSLPHPLFKPARGSRKDKSWNILVKSQSWPNSSHRTSYNVDLQSSFSIVKSVYAVYFLITAVYVLISQLNLCCQLAQHLHMMLHFHFIYYLFICSFSLLSNQSVCELNKPMRLFTYISLNSKHWKQCI